MKSQNNVGRCKLLLQCPDGIAEMPADILNDGQKPRPKPGIPDFPDVTIRPTERTKREKKDRPAKPRGPIAGSAYDIVSDIKLDATKKSIPPSPHPTTRAGISTTVNRVNRGSKKGLRTANATLILADVAEVLIRHSDEIRTVADIVKVLYDEYGDLAKQVMDQAGSVIAEFAQNHWAEGLRGAFDFVNPTPIVAKLADTIIDKTGLDLPSVMDELDPFTPAEMSGGLDVDDGHFVYVKPQAELGQDSPAAQAVTDVFDTLTDVATDAVNWVVDTGEGFVNTVKGWFS